jgi:hypothetical protein
MQAPEFSTNIQMFSHELVMLRNNQINLFNLHDGNVKKFALFTTDHIYVNMLH